MESAVKDTWSEYLTKAKEAEESLDFALAKKLIDAALWKAEQYSLSTGILEQTLQYAARFYSNRFMDAQAIVTWERLLVLQRKTAEPSPQQLLQAYEQMANCYERMNDLKNYVHYLKELVRLDEVVGAGNIQRAKRIDKLADALENFNCAAECLQWRAQAKKLRGEEAKPPEPKKETGSLQRKVFLGHLLARSGIVKFEELNKNLAIAKTLELPIGQVLISNDLLTDEQLDASLKLQAMIRDDTMSFDQAANALQLFATKNVPLQEAVDQAMGRVQPAQTMLGSMLVQAGLITDAELQQVLAASVKTGFPLGKQLVLSRALGANVVAKVLEVQEQVRLNTMTHGDAIKVLSGLK